MFQLTNKEIENLRSQNATTNFNMIRSNPYIFTEQGGSSMQSLQNEAKEETKRMGFICE